MFKSNNRTILQPGKICTFDPLNAYKQADSGILHVRLVERVKYKLFGKSLWKVCPYLDVNDDNSFVCPEYLLYPEGMAVIRYPADTPTFNEIDLRALDIIMNQFEKDYMSNEQILEVGYMSSSRSAYNTASNYTLPRMTKKELDRLKALREKIDLSIKMKEV